MVAAIGGPKRLSTEVLGVAGGFFVPLFFVVLGARIDLRGLAEDPAMIGLALALAGLTAAVHVLAARVTRQPRAAGLLASAQLGVPAAIVALGLSEHVITSTQASGDRHRVDDQPGRLQRRGGSAGPAARRSPPGPPADNRTTPAPSSDPARRRSAYVVFRSTVSDLRGWRRKVRDVGCTHEFEHPTPHSES